MDTILLYAKTRQQALGCIDALTHDIKALPMEDQHKLFFRRILMGAYIIFPGHITDEKLIENPPTDEKDKAQRTEAIIPDDTKELVIFPQDDEIRLKRIQDEKKVVLYRNCMCVVGEGDKAKATRDNIISWLLGKAELEVENGES